MRNRYTQCMYIVYISLAYIGLNCPKNVGERENARSSGKGPTILIQPTIIYHSLCARTTAHTYTRCHSLHMVFITPKNINRNGPKHSQCLSRNATAILLICVPCYLLFYYGHTHSHKRTHNALAGEEDDGEKINLCALSLAV